MRDQVWHFILLLVFALGVVACGSSTAITPEGEEGVSSRNFADGECVIAYDESLPAYVAPGPDAIPVGQALPGRVEMLQVQTFDGGQLFYQKDDGLWLRLDGVEYTVEGDCTQP